MKTERHLWCVHTIGPDDVNAAPDFETAWAWSEHQNRMMVEYTAHINMQDDPYWPEVRCVPALWPGDEQSHAADLVQSRTMFSLPTSEEAGA